MLLHLLLECGNDWGGMDSLMSKLSMTIGALALSLSVFFGVHVHGITVESYSSESFSVQNPSFSGGTSAPINMNGQVIRSSGLVVLGYNYGFFGIEAGRPLSSIQNPESNDPLIAAKVLGAPLFYPNPFSISSGAELGYKLSKNMDIEIRFYDIRANEIFRKTFLASHFGGMSGYNKVFFDRSTIGRYDLPAGIYFFVLIHDGSVLGRGKFAVKQ